MSFTNDPTNPIDRMRLKIGDADPNNALVEDIWYQYYLDETGSESKAALEVARSILARYSSYTREREGQVEVYGSEIFSNYLSWLKQMLNNPDFGFIGSPMPYAGGISQADMIANRENVDNVPKVTPLKNTETIYSDDLQRILGEV